MTDNQRPSALDQMKGNDQKPQPQAGQGFKASSKPQPKAKSEAPKESRESSNQLAIHNRFEDLAGCLAEQSEHRLAALTGAIFSNREQEVEKYVDLLEAAESGELDYHLVVKGLNERRQKRLEAGEPPQEYNFNIDGFDKRGYGIDLDIAITEVALEPFWKQPKAALPEA